MPLMPFPVASSRWLTPHSPTLGLETSVWVFGHQGVLRLGIEVSRFLALRVWEEFGETQYHFLGRKQLNNHPHLHCTKG